MDKTKFFSKIFMGAVIVGLGTVFFYSQAALTIPLAFDNAIQYIKSFVVTSTGGPSGTKIFTVNSGGDQQIYLNTGIDTIAEQTLLGLTTEGKIVKTNNSVAETDPVFTTWDKSSGISITESQISDLDHFTNTDETDPVFTANSGEFVNISDTQNNIQGAKTFRDSLTVDNNATIEQNLTVNGNLYVNGTETVINSTTVQIDDKKIMLGEGGDDNLVNGGGLELSGDDDTSLLWTKSNGGQWGSSDNFNLSGGKEYRIDDISLLSNSPATRGSSVLGATQYAISGLVHNIYSSLTLNTIPYFDGNGFADSNIIFSGGKVGIGTDNPEANLQINVHYTAFNPKKPGLLIDNVSDGDAIIKLKTEMETSTNLGLLFENTETSKTGHILYSNGSSISINSDDTTNDDITILSDGKVGIGTNNPQAKLDVNGTFATRGTIRILSNNERLVPTSSFIEIQCSNGNCDNHIANGSVDGQKLTIFSNNQGNTNKFHDSDDNLYIAGDYEMDYFDTLVLIRSDSESAWVELSRSSPND